MGGAKKNHGILVAVASFIAFGFVFVSAAAKK
jgi:hypothetical protein